MSTIFAKPVSENKSAATLLVIRVGMAFGGSTSENTRDVNSNDAIPKNAGTDIVNPAPSSIHLETDRDTYDAKNDIVIVSGAVSKILPNTMMLLVVFDPMGERVSITQVHVDSNGEFTEKISMERSSWLQNGIYTIKAHYGDDVTANTEFTFMMNLENGKSV
jgi:hypothetical protein